MDRKHKMRLALVVLALTVAVIPQAQAGFFDRFGKKSDTEVAPPTPPDAVGDPGVSPAGGQDDAAIGMRLDRLEQQNRQLTGQVEELGYQVRQLQEQIRQLQGGGGGAPPQQRSEARPAPQMAPSGTASDTALTAPPASGDAIGQTIGSAAAPGSPQLGAPPRNLGTLSVDPNAPPSQQAPINLSSATAAADAPPAPTGNSRADYDAAYGLVMKGDYEVAEAAFKTFLQNYPRDPLSADAQYWVGESQFQRQDFRDAADTMLTGYKQYPKSAKAPDMLFKLGQSLKGLGQRDAACATYAEVLKQYPKTSNALMQRVKSEQASASC